MMGKGVECGEGKGCLLKVIQVLIIFPIFKCYFSSSYLLNGNEKHALIYMPYQGDTSTHYFSYFQILFFFLLSLKWE
jgi:hypothetical protein